MGRAGTLSLSETGVLFLLETFSSSGARDQPVELQKVPCWCNSSGVGSNPGCRRRWQEKIVEIQKILAAPSVAKIAEIVRGEHFFAIF